MIAASATFMTMSFGKIVVTALLAFTFHSTGAYEMSLYGAKIIIAVIPQSVGNIWYPLITFSLC